MSKTVKDIIQMKSKEKITVLTGYDSTMTTLCDKADIILVGDSAGMVMLGYDNTKDVTMDDMVRFTTAVKNAKKKIITFDLNPLSRTAQTADVKIVDNVTRAMKLLISESRKQSKKQNSFDNKKNLKITILEIQKNLKRRAKNV